MRAMLLLLARLAVTAVVVVAGLVAAHWMWVHYELAPRTRDGRIRADVVSVSPDVNGFVVDVAVIDNQKGRPGPTPVHLDPGGPHGGRGRGALAAVSRERALLAEARREAQRDVVLGDVVAVEAREQDQAHVDDDAAALQQGLADVAAARLNLQRTTVVARVN